MIADIAVIARDRKTKAQRGDEEKSFENTEEGGR